MATARHEETDENICEAGDRAMESCQVTQPVEFTTYIPETESEPDNGVDVELGLRQRHGQHRDFHPTAGWMGQTPYLEETHQHPTTCAAECPRSSQFQQQNMADARASAEPQYGGSHVRMTSAWADRNTGVLYRPQQQNDNDLRGNCVQQPYLPTSPTHFEQQPFVTMMQMVIEQNRTMMEFLQRDRSAADNANNRFSSNSVQGPMYQVMPDFSKSIRVFDGESQNEAKIWLERLQGTALLHQWPEQFKLEAARSHLTGAARLWYEGRQTELLTWDRFEAAFKKTFVRECSKTHLWKDMIDRVQKSRESIHPYFHDKIRLCNNLGLSFAETKEQIAIGLHARDLAAMIVGKTHCDFDEMYGDMIAFERMCNERKLRHSSEQHDRTTPRPTQKLNPTSQNTKPEKMEWLPARDSTGQPLCFKCKTYGHVASECPIKSEPVIEKKNLPNNSEKIVRTSEVNKRKVNILGKHHRDSSELVRDFVINDHYRVRGLIDNGSAVCTITETAARHLNLFIHDHSQKLYAWGDLKSPALTTTGKTYIKLSIDGVVAENMEILIVPNDYQEYDLLVGRSFSERDELAYVRKGKWVAFGYENDAPFKDIDVECLIQDTNELTLSTTAENTVIRAKSNEEVTVEGDGKRFVLRVINESSEDIVKEKGEPLCRVQKNFEFASPMDIYSRVSQINPDELNVGANFSEPGKENLVQLVNEYRDCFALNLKELGCTPLAKMKIVDNNIPVKCAPYKVSAKDRETIKQLVQELKETGIVTETDSPYASPVLLVRKKNGEPRLVVDYRKLNLQTAKLNYPVSCLEDQLTHLSGAKLYATLDLANGYLQVPLAEESRPKTAFVTQDTTGEFTRVVFGLSNAPFEFVRLMNLVLGPLRNKICCCYLDDVIVPAKDEEELLLRLRLVLEAFRSAKLTLNLKKCEFGKSEIKFLGHIIVSNGLKPGSEKVRAIEEFETPTSVHAVKRFLGLTGFFRRFVPNYALMAKPLTDLTKCDFVFDFNEKCARAFNSLKTALTTPPILRLFDPSADTELHTDASAAGIAGMLLQRDENSLLHLVYCVSKKTTEAESMYHSSRLELLAIVWCIERLRSLLIGIHFKVVTDCQAIVFLNSKKNINPQVARWFAILQEYDYEILHRKGDKMCHIDALSRAPVESAEDIEDSLIDNRMPVLSLNVEEAMVTIQRSDEQLNRFCRILGKVPEQRTKEEQHCTRNYELCKNKLVAKICVDGSVRKLTVIPKSMRKSILVKYHDLSGHFSVDRTVQLILTKCWFPRLRRYVRRHISGCLECLIHKKPSGKKAGLLHPIPPPRRPFERVHVDNLGPFIKTTMGNTYIMVVIDAFSRFVCLYPLKSTKTSIVIKKLSSFFLQFGVCESIVCDRGTCFTAINFREFCEKHGVKLTFNSPRHPEGNGMVERVNRTLLPMLKTELQNEKRWDVRLAEIQFNLNQSVNKTTRKSPFKVLFGYQPSLQNANIGEMMNPTDWTLPEEEWEQIDRNIRKGQLSYKNQHDKKRYVGVHYDVGEIVVVKGATEATGESRKLQSIYKGPYVVSEVLPADTYRIEKILCDGNNRVHVTTSHVSQLKNYHNPAESEASSESDGGDTPDEGPPQGPPRGPTTRPAVPTGVSASTSASVSASACAGVEKGEKIVKREKRVPGRLKDFDLN